MMPGFRRAQLRGSDELFRPTHDDGTQATVTAPTRPAATPPPPQPPPASREGRLVRLSDEDINLLADAVQRLKFPTSAKPAMTKPSVDEFERLEDLRQKLLAAR